MRFGSVPLASMERSEPGDRTLFHPVSFLPISELPTEDIDVVEVGIPGSPFPFSAMVQREGVLHWVSYGPGPMATYATNPLASPNTPGVDPVSDGTYAVAQSLGFGYVVTGLPAGAPAIAPGNTYPLGPVPTRYDCDPILFTYDPAGPPLPQTRAIFFGGQSVHCRGVVLAGPWDVTLPSPMVTAVDGLLGPVSGGFPAGLLWVPTVTGLSVINPLTGAIVASHVLPSQPTREIDIQFGGGFAYHQRNGFLHRFSAATGALLASTALLGPNIEGNDPQISPSGTVMILVTVPFIYKIEVATGAIAAVYPTSGGPVFPVGVFPSHQRNHDPFFSPAPVAPAKWVYLLQGYAVIGDVFPIFGAPAPAAVAIPGTLVDGVDGQFVDDTAEGADPGDTRFEISTLPGLTSVVDALALAHVPGSPLATPGGRLIDVDDTPAPRGTTGNFILQTNLFGLTRVGGPGGPSFGPFDWWVPTSTGAHVVDMGAVAVIEFIPTPPLYRGGDPLATSLLPPGPAEPAFQIEQNSPDQDFLPKCWEYKFAVNRMPYAWFYTQPQFYPHWVPYGFFGPPAWGGYDLLNDYKLLTLQNQSIVVLNHDGNLVHTINLAARPIGGIVWDWDHKIGKIRLQNQSEAIINLAYPFAAGPPFLTYVPYGDYIRWYPVIDRINGWECTVRYKGRQVWIQDHLQPANPPIIVGLAARAIRRPVFDEQRKVMCIPLANRTVAFINTHRLRLGFPDFLYYSPVLPAHIVEQPVFDLYNHYTLCQLRGSRVAVLNTDTGNLLWDSGPLPYWPTGPLVMDCYNKIGKGFYRDAANYYEMHLNLFPLVFGGAPVLNWILLGGQPYGYPYFDSMDGYEFVQLPGRIVWQSVFQPLSPFVSIALPFPAIGNLYVDRVNKYGLLALQGNRLFWMNLHKITTGVVGPAAFHDIAMPAPVGPRGCFDVTGHRALWALDDGSVAVIDMVNGTLLYHLPGLPKLSRQLYHHPYSSLVNWPADNAGIPVDVTLNLRPTTANPPSNPSVNVAFTGVPGVDLDLSAPTPPLAVEMLQLSLQPDSDPGSVDFEIQTAPGNIVQAVNMTDLDTPDQVAPSEGTADTGPGGGVPGGLAEVSTVAEVGDVVCFTVFDNEGDAAPQVCVNVVSLGVDEAPGRVSFALRGENPIRREALFDFVLPAAGRAELGIYDVSGRLVESVVSGVLDAGEHTATWRVSRAIAPGIYFARFKAGKDESSVRLVVLY